MSARKDAVARIELHVKFLIEAIWHACQAIKEDADLLGLPICLCDGCGGDVRARDIFQIAGNVVFIEAPLLFDWFNPEPTIELVKYLALWDAGHRDKYVWAKLFYWAPLSRVSLDRLYSACHLEGCEKCREQEAQSRQQLKALSSPSQPDGEDLAPKTPPVIINGPDDPVIVLGKEKAPLPSAQYRVVKALVDAHSEGERLSKDALCLRTRDEKGNTVEDPVGALERLCKRDQDWKRVIDMAGVPGRGYGLKSHPPKPTHKN